MHYTIYIPCHFDANGKVRIGNVMKVPLFEVYVKVAKG